MAKSVIHKSRRASTGPPPELATRIARLSASTREHELACEASRGLRDHEIDLADEAGVPVREIARWASMSAGSIQRILARVEARRQAR